MFFIFHIETNWLNKYEQDIASQTSGANKGAVMIAALEGVTTYTAARYRQPALQCNTSSREAAADDDDDGQRESVVLAHLPSNKLIWQTGVFYNKRDFTKTLTRYNARVFGYSVCVCVCACMHAHNCVFIEAFVAIAKLNDFIWKSGSAATAAERNEHKWNWPSSIISYILG